MKPLFLALLVSVVSLFQSAPPRLLQASDLTYVGAFRMPPYQGGTKSFDYSGAGLAFDATKQTLMAITLASEVATFSIPTPSLSPTLAGLPRAAIVQPYTDVLAGHRTDMGLTSLGGLLPLADRLIVSGFVYYDNSFPSTSVSHFRTGPDFTTVGAVVGPVQVGASNQAGFVGGYMTPIPMEWQTPLGGPALTGLCCLSIISRTSLGPSVSVFDPMQIGAVTPVPAVRVLGYPIQHPTLGTWDTGTRFNGATTVSGVVFPGGTRSVLFFGRLGVNFCYGQGTATQALHGTLSTDGATKYCYDPADGGKGGHGYPYKPFVWAYDVNDLVAVKAGTKNAWDVQPYATWELHTPFENDRSQIVGAAYDPATSRVFLSVGFEDGTMPLVQVFALGSVNVPPPAPIDCVVSTWGAWSAWVSDLLEQTRTRDRTVLTPAANLGAPCPALRELEHQPLPLPVSSVVTTTKTCTLTVMDVPPDAVGGWKVQYQRNGVSHGSATSTAPYVRAAIVNVGSYSVTAVWTKTGQVSVTRPASDVVCK